MCQFFGMKDIGKDEFGDSIFEIDFEKLQRDQRRKLMPAVKRLLKVYEELA